MYIYICIYIYCRARERLLFFPIHISNLTTYKFYLLCNRVPAPLSKNSSPYLQQEPADCSPATANLLPMLLEHSLVLDSILGGVYHKWGYPK